MHGVIGPIGRDADARGVSVLQRLRTRLWELRAFLAIVVIPTALVGFYYYVIASDQYVSEAHFIVRQAEQPTPSIGGMGVLSVLTGGEHSSPEAMSVADYLTSHDVVSALNANGALTSRYSRPDVDSWSALRTSGLTPEKLLKYFLAMTKIDFNSSSGITTVQARAFTPQDAYTIATGLMKLGDQRVNSLNDQVQSDTVASARRQLVAAEQAMNRAQADITRFRAVNNDIDPTGTGNAQTQLVTTLTGALTGARAQLQNMGQSVSRDSPQYVALSRQVQAMEAQLAAQSRRLAGSGRTIASQVASYNALQLRQEFAAKRYSATAAAVDAAQEQVKKKQLYLVRVVNPNMPVKPLYPQRGRIVATVLISLLLIYGVGWLLVAGVREHAI
ncbi:lipopolysaccharide biosynthesis protein [Sphingomonas sp. R86521]|uniref:lipopolysaccharide biosynthesis protein n=1 Tax=Sphingomonas sp. R86521 TaxID=3093860 RepID=UPI0036D30216